MSGRDRGLGRTDKVDGHLAAGEERHCNRVGPVQGVHLHVRNPEDPNPRTGRIERHDPLELVVGVPGFSLKNVRMALCAVIGLLAYPGARNRTDAGVRSAHELRLRGRLVDEQQRFRETLRQQPACHVNVERDRDS